jgi:hypothetical protein
MEPSKRPLYHSLTGEEYSAENPSFDSDRNVSSSFLEELERKSVSEAKAKPKDKEFMQLWNTHNRVFAQTRTFPLKSCLLFVKNYRQELKTLEKQFSWHLFALRNSNLLTDDDLLLILLELKSKRV